MNSRSLALALAFLCLGALYAPGPRTRTTEAQAQTKSLDQLIKKARQEPTTVGKKNKLEFRLEGANLCRRAKALVPGGLNDAVVKTWNQTIDRYSKTEPTGCNYDVQVMAIGASLKGDNYELHLGEPGLAPTWSGPALQPEAIPDWRSLLHPLLAIVIAILFSRVLLGLGLAILLGALVAVDGSPMAAASLLATESQGALFSQWSGWILVFTCSLIAMVSLMRINGGMAGLVRLLSARVRSQKDAETATAFLGFGLFFDDYANTVVVGSTMGTVTDRFGSSRAKLAYIVDSTSAPLAGLAFLSTWIGYEVGLLGKQCQELGLELNGYALFLEGLGFRLYCLLALALVFISIRSRRELGPMLQAQREAAMAMGDELEAKTNSDQQDGPSAAASRALLPLALTFGGILGLLAYKAHLAGVSLQVFSVDGLRQILMAEDQMIGWLSLDISSILGLAGLLGLSLSILLSPVALSTQVQAMGRGLKEVSPAIGILLLAWVLGAMTSAVGTGAYLEAVVGETVNPGLLPAITFLLGAAIAFATGTSFGTMGILIPIILPLAAAVGDVSLLIICSAAILDGAIFGDHCSPLSDTTILSSLASNCPLEEHVRTQLPYALLAMVVALCIGYLPAGMGWYGPLVAIPLGLISLYGAYWLLSQPIQVAASVEPEVAPGPESHLP